MVSITVKVESYFCRFKKDQIIANSVRAKKNKNLTILCQKMFLFQFYFTTFAHIFMFHMFCIFDNYSFFAAKNIIRRDYNFSPGFIFANLNCHGFSDVKLTRLVDQLPLTLFSLLHVVVSVTRLGDLLDFGQLFKALPTIYLLKSPTFFAHS